MAKSTLMPDTSAVSQTGDIEIDSAVIARGLKMPVARVVEEMRCGNLYGRVEEGVAEDEGRYRLCFRYRGRELRMVFAADGRLIGEDLDVPASPKGREILKALIRQELIRQARLRVPTTYGRLAERIPLSPQGTLETVGKALDALMEDDVRENRPLVAALAVEAASPGFPAKRFFRKASELGKFFGGPDGVEAFAFHAGELQRAIHFYAAASKAEPTRRLADQAAGQGLHHRAGVG
jgi:Family of unknown function (DUF6522)